MSTNKPTGSNAKAKPTEGQGNGGAKETNRLSDDAHDFVLKDTPVDGANQNLGNAHEGNYSFAARMGNATQGDGAAPKAVDDLHPFIQTSSSMLSEDASDLTARKSQDQNGGNDEAGSAHAGNGAASQSIDTLFSQEGAMAASTFAQGSALPQGGSTSSAPVTFVSNNGTTPNDPVQSDTSGGPGGSGGSEEKVNSAPVELDLFGTSTNEDTSQIITQEMLLATFEDADGDTLTADNLSVDGGTLVDNSDGTWTFTPDPDFNGDISISFDVSDGQSTTSGSGTINVKPVNDAAVVSGPVEFGVAEDGTLVIREAGLLANASDVDGDTLSVQNLAASGGSLTDNGDGTWTFAPADDFNGTIKLTYDVNDGTVNTPATGSIDVAEVNDGPQAGAVDLGATAEDTSVTFTEADLLANSSDIDGDTLSVTSVSVDADYGVLTDNGDGTYTFAPADDVNANDVPFSFTVSDGTTTDSATAVLDITAVNDAAVVSGPVDFDMVEDGSITITEAGLLANASDVDGDTLSVQNLAASGGDLTDNGDGTWTFAPADDFNGTINLTYDVNDGTVNTPATGSIDVAEANDGPQAGAVDLGATAEDTSVTFSEADLLANSSDIDGDTLSVTSVSVSADYGTLTDNGDGTYTFAPAQDVNANDVPFSFTVSDGTTTDSATAVLDITAVNDAAVVSGPVDFDMVEDGSITITEAGLLANASDVDGDTLSVQNLAASGGDLTDNGDGTWTFAPADDFNGTINLTYDVNDGTVNTPATGSIDVAEANDGPVAGAVDLGATAEDTSVTFSEADLLANSSDIDGDTLSVTSVSVDADYGVLTDNGDGTYTFAPAQDVNANDVPFSFTVSDGTTTDSATAVLDITAVNDAAVVSGPVDFDMVEDGSITITEAGLLANASDVDGDTLSVQNLAASGGDLTDNGDGTWTFAPADDFNGTINLTYDVNDGTVDTPATGTIDVAEANDGPQAGAVDLGATAEDTNVTFTEADLLANSSDIDGDTLSVTSVSVSADYGVLTDNGDGTYTFAPAQDVNANDVPFSFTVSDGTTTDSATAVLDITAVNDAAVVSDGVIFEMAEDGSITITEAELLANASDVDGDTLSVQNLAASGGDLTDNGDGTWTFAPADDFNGTINLTYDVNDGTVDTPATGTIDVAEANDGPQAGAVDLGATAEDTSVTFTEADLLANSSDIDGDTLSVTSVSVDADYGVLTDNGDGTYTFAPADDVNANDVPFSFTVSDGTTTDSATAVLDITAVNDAAVVSGPVDFDMVEDGSITITEAGLLANASDVDGDTLSVQNLAASGGDLTDNGDGTWTFVPADDFNGTIKLTYDVNDGTVDTPATGTIDVAEANDGPVAGAVDLGATAEDTSVTFSEADLLANSSDIDGDTLSVTSVSVSADYGVLTDNGDGTYTFAPADDVNANDVPFSFTVSDGTTTDSATAVLDITAVNDAAVVSDGVIFEMAEDGSITITEAELLANASDVDGDTLSVQNLATDGGALKDNGDGTWTFTPDTDFNGSISLRYDVSDGTESTRGGGWINVAEVNDGPNAGSIKLRDTNEDTSITIKESELLAKSSDVDGDKLTIVDISVSDEFGKITDNGDGTYRFDPAKNVNADDVPFSFTVSDGTKTDTATATLNITAVNDTAHDIALSGNSVTENEDGAVVGVLTTSDVDEGDTHTYTVSDERFQVVDGKLMLKSGASLDHEQEGVVSVTITTTDQDGASYEESFDISVRDLNEGPTDISFTGGKVNETVVDGGDIGQPNDPSGSTVAVLSTTDEDSGDTFTYEISNDPSGHYEIVGNEVRVKAGQTIDRESETSHDVTIKVTDSGGKSYSETIQIDVQDYEGSYTSEAFGESIKGTSEEDTITGDAGDNAIDSGDGNDVVYAGDGNDTIMGSEGQDYIYGGDGIDTVDYSDSTEGVTVSIPFGGNTGGDAEGDVLNSIENVIATDYDDYVHGSNDGSVVELGSGNDKFDNNQGYTDQHDVVDAGAGDDIVYTGDGDDTITGGAGDDYINGEGGTDTAVFSGNYSDYTITQFGNSFTVRDDRANSPDGTDTVHNVENFQFADGVVTAEDMVNDAAAVSGPTSFSMAEDGTITISETELLANASDVNGDTLSVQNLTASGGALTDNGNGTWTFEPAQDFNGSIDLTYNINDGELNTATTGTISVSAVNDGPVAGAVDLGATAEDTSVTFSEADLLANSSDIDGDTLSVTSVSVDADYGVLTDNGDGTYTFAPAQDVNANDVPFSFTVSDGTTTDSATAVLDITAVNDAAVVSGPVDFNMSEDGSITIYESGLLANASDVDGDTLSVQNLAASGGLVTDNGNGTWTFTPDSDFNGTIDLTYNVNDGTVNTPATGTIEVAEVNDNPDDIALSSNSVAENDAGGIIGNLTTTDVDTGDTHSYSVSDDRFEVVEGQLKLKDGVSLDHEADESISVEVTSTDQNGGTYAETFNVSVTDVNEGPTDIHFLTTNTVTTSNYGTVNGVTVTAKSINSEGGQTAASADYVSHTDTGFGVDSGSGSWTDQLEYNTNTNQSEELIFDFDFEQSSVTVDIDRLYGAEGGGGEEGIWQVYRDGQIVGGGHIDNTGESMTTALNVVASDGGTFDQIVFTALDYGGGYTAEGNTSDYFVSALQYQSEDTVSIGENSTSGTVAVLSATDPEGGEFTYDFVDAQGNVVTDGNFQIVGNEIQVRSDASIDYETGTQHELMVRVTDDGGNTHTETLTVDVVDEYEADISFTANSGLTTTPSGGSVVATANFDAHPGSTSHYYTLTDSDFGKFSINSSTGELMLNSGIVAGDTYNVTVKATDNNGRTYEEDLTFFFGGDTDGSISISNANSQIVYGFGGSDSLQSGSGDDVLVGGSGNDTIQLSDGADVIDGGGGWDSLDIWSSEDANVNLAEGTVDGVGFEGTTISNIEEVWGGSGDDTITGSASSENFYGWDGNDTISGGGGNDYIEGESGNDILNGDAGADTIKGGSGNDVITGGTGNDILHGNDGDDIFIYEIGDGSDTIYGGSGSSWTDAIELQGFSADSYGADWTLELTSGSVVTESAESLALSDDASGTITFDDGSEIDFQQLEQINW